ncbi:hypothetical protein OPT61_g4365 [Boeremia exigua]|uniref:Uncharacterized protein n=1 Tax=Boeremia exigua TaxID=749465 RepID=A0ACC2IED2_9PLEO|nr:hypothetical protein OPT61_g4365 [Boeremia exigua]
MAALPLAIPAAAAGLAYLNARHGISYDWPLLSSFVPALIGIARAERSDRLNVFYDLEVLAQGSRADHTWIIFHGQSWTYKQAYDIVLRYGTWLKTKGVQSGEIVAMDFVNSETFIWVWFGLWSIGAKPAFINYNLTGKPLIHTIKTSTARLVLVDEESKANFAEAVMIEHGFSSAPGTAVNGREARYDFEMDQSEVPRSVKSQALAEVQQQGITATPQKRQLEIVFFDKQLQDSILMLQPIRQPDSCRAGQLRNGMAMLIYTSGTTGLPKPAIMAWAKCSGAAKYVSSWMNIKDDVMYTSMPLYHSSASVLGVCAVLRAGGTICLSSKFSHKTFWPEVVASKATIIHYVGETCRYLLSAPPSALDRAHHVRAAFGNGLRPDVWEPFKERFGIQTIYEFYAATEAPGGMWNRSDNTFSSGAIGRDGTIGTLLFGAGRCVVRTDPDADGAQPLRNNNGLCQVCDWNESGELLYKLDPANIESKFQGYFGNDKATSSKIIRNVKKSGDAYFRSGDLVRADKEGRWWFVDRIGDTFRWKSENVSTAEVADAVGRHTAVDEVAVYGVQVPGHDGRAGCAAVVLNASALSTSANAEKSIAVKGEVLKALAAHVTKDLPAFARPIWIRVTRQLQTTGTNKLQKHVLQKEGIDPEAIEQAGDALYWLSGGTPEASMLHMLYIPGLDRSGQGIIDTAFQRLLFRCSVQKEKVGCPQLRMYNDGSVRSCNKKGVPNAVVMQPSTTTSGPLKPGKGRVRRQVGRAAQIKHAELSSSGGVHVAGRGACLRSSYAEISRFVRTRHDRITFDRVSLCSRTATRSIGSFQPDAQPEQNIRKALDDFKESTRIQSWKHLDDEWTGLRVADLTQNKAGREVEIAGYLSTRRDVNQKLSFTMLRSKNQTWCIQVVSTGNIEGEEAEAHVRMRTLREWTPVVLRGRLLERKRAKNETFLGMKLIADREIALTGITPLNEIPNDIIIKQDTGFGPEQRHLQLRTDAELRNNIIQRQKAMQRARLELADSGWKEIETPILFKSTPEGAREFLVPTRTKGLAYALPQSPQQYKQILMASGFTKYYQFARCFRDEDLRADRQPEFTQLDMEMSFAAEEDIMAEVEKLLRTLWKPCLRTAPTSPICATTPRSTTSPRTSPQT